MKIDNEKTDKVTMVLSNNFKAGTTTLPLRTFQFVCNGSLTNMWRGVLFVANRGLIVYQDGTEE